MQTEDLITSIDKIAMPKDIEDQVWDGVSENKRKKIKKKNSLKIPIAACLTILFISLSFNDTVRAYVAYSGVDFFHFLSTNYNYDVQNIGESGLQEPLTMTKDGITITLNQCIFSNSEMFLDYTITADDVRSKMERNDGLFTCDAVFYKDKDVTEKLFNEWLSGQGNSNLYNPEAESTVKDINTAEMAITHNGYGFKYEGKTLKVVLYVYEVKGFSRVKIDFPFEIKVKSLYPEKSKLINESVQDNNGNVITVSKITSTFSKVIVTGMGPLQEPGQIKVLDSTGNKINWQGCGTGTETYPFEFEFTRNNNDTGNYTIQVYDANGNLLKEIPISFDSL